MKILMASYHFAPSVGGIETISMILARVWSQMGHDVTVVTATSEKTENDDEFPFEIVRNPDFKHLRRLILSHEIYFQNNISLQLLWAWIGTGKPLFIAHQTWLYSDTRAEAVRTLFKRLFIRRAVSISISRAIAGAIAPRSHLIGNAYDSQTFRVLPSVTRDKDLVFVGRLVEDKGVDVLLQALEILKKRGLTPHLSVVGSGPQQAELRALCTELGLDNQIEWAGTVRGEELAKLLNAHQILVVPSTWQEPFGIVALEGIACGCAVVGSRGGGLPDAIGPCGALFENGNAEDLARVLAPILAQLLENPATLQTYQAGASAHLEKHSEQSVARAYLAVFQGHL